MKSSLIIKTVELIAAVLALAANASGNESHAIVKIGGCSGVNVDPSGLILTVKHCDLPDTTTVRFPEIRKQAQARRIYVARETEGPVVFEIIGSGADQSWPWVPVASEVPSVGDRVYSLGYPARGGGKQLRAEGSIKRGAELTFRGGAFLGNAVDFHTGPGWSGGPLFNSRGEVVGLLNSGDGSESIYTSFASTHQAWQAVRPQDSNQTQPTIIVETSPGCAPCEQIKRDVAAGEFGDANVKYTQPTGGYVPRITVNGHVYPEPYTGPRRLIEWIKGTLRLPLTVGESVLDPIARGIDHPPSRPPSHPDPTTPGGGAAGEIDLGEPSEPEYLDEAPAPVPVEEDEAEIDWSAVRIIVLLAEQETSELRGGLRTRLISLAVGPLERAVAEHTGGKAALSVISERVNAEKYAAIVEAARVEPDPVYLLVIVGQQESSGFIRDRIKRRVVRILDSQVGERLKQSPVEVVFERTHRQDVEAIHGALRKGGDLESDGDEESGNDLPWYWGLLAAAAGAAKRRYLDR